VIAYCLTCSTKRWGDATAHTKPHPVVKCPQTKGIACYQGDCDINVPGRQLRWMKHLNLWSQSQDVFLSCSRSMVRFLRFSSKQAASYRRSGTRQYTSEITHGIFVVLATALKNLQSLSEPQWWPGSQEKQIILYLQRQRATAISIKEGQNRSVAKHHA
jgi:hypothetical protein